MLARRSGRTLNSLHGSTPRGSQLSLVRISLTIFQFRLCFRVAQACSKVKLSYFDAICKGEKHLLDFARAAFKGAGSGQQFSIQDIENAG